MRDTPKSSATEDELLNIPVSGTRAALQMLTAIGQQLAISAEANRAFSQHWSAIAAEVGRTAAEHRAKFEVGLSLLKLDFSRGWPPNWGKDLDDWDRAVEIIRDEHVPLVWTPPREIVVQLVAARSTERRHALLVQRRRAIAVHCTELAQQLDSPHLADIRDACIEAAAEIRLGRYRGGQALASAALADAAANVYGHAQLKAARLSFDRGDPMEAAAIEMRTVLTFAPAAMALRNAKEPQFGYNRHLTAHAVSSGQYTPPHAVMSVMIATALAREAQEQIREGKLVPAA